RWGGIVSQGLGTSMLQMGNIVRNPRIWIPPTLASAVTGPIATCVFKLQMNGEPVNSGMGTCGLCGPIGVWTGWVAPSEKAVEMFNAVAISPSSMDWIGLLLIAIVLPAVLTLLFAWPLRKMGWIKDGDLKLDL
ncbi:MAG: PTS sugar transporter subunit IIC, partial [Oscillospiraceae bacterium]|nr:PTS sugar transporter subunit IIC [Oscillospiraceae bacterium]